MNKKIAFIILLALQSNNVVSMVRTIPMKNLQTGEFVKIDVDAPIPGDHHGYRPLHRFTALKQPAGILLCLLKGAKIDNKDNDGNTALMVAALNKHTECIRVLLESGADGSLYNSVGIRAVDFSQAYEDDTTLSLFKQYKAYDYPNLGWTKDKSRIEIQLTPERWNGLSPENQARLAQAIDNMQSKQDIDSVFAARQVAVELGIIGDNQKKQ